MYREHLTGEKWDVEFHCLPTARQPEEKLVIGTMDRADISFANLLTIKAVLAMVPGTTCTTRIDVVMIEQLMRN